MKSFINIPKINIKDKLHEGHTQLDELLNSNNWIDKNIVKNIDSKIMYVDNMIPIVYCKSIIRCPPNELFDYLVHNISETCHEWNDLMYHSSVLHQFETNDNSIARISTIISDGYPADDREDVYMHLCDICEKDNALAYYELSFGIDNNIIPNCIPLNISNKARNLNKLVRSQMHFAAKQIKINEDGCEYITIWHYDPMGWLSKFIPRKILGNIILKNLVHEHEKIINNYKEVDIINNKTYNFLNSILSSLINKNIILFLLFLIIWNFIPTIYNIFPLTGIYDSIISLIFYNNMFWSFILFIGCIVSPKLMIRINSVPWAFHPSFNMDVAYQTILYIALHEKSINLLSHLTIASDSIFWFIILLNIHYVVFPIFIILLLLQAYNIYIKSSLPFVMFLLFSWLTSIIIAYIIGNYIGWDTSQQISIIFISISAFLRVITHTVEQIPPGVASILYTYDKPKYDVFKKYKDNNLTLGKKCWLLMCFLQGYTAEFISSLPCRLFIVHVFYLADKLGISVPTIGSWEKLKEHAIAIRNNGWKASLYTSWMCEWIDKKM